ncbi:MAG TPA: universal stress protein [Chitinophagaceae bacterium]|nr:universal stress protein [Chitinophagaceae bacterium]
MKTIVVPIDFSDISNNAMEYAIGLAKNTGSSILLFHAYQVPVSMTDVPIVLVSVEDLQKNAESKMAEVKASVEQETGGTVKVYAETKLGDTVDELENICNHVKPFAVVMGTKGATGVERVFFGSTTLTTIKHLSWPVIVVPPDKKYSAIKKIGFACDFREVVKTTPTHFIKDFVSEFKAELHVLNVDYKSSHFKPDTPEESALLHTMLEDLNPKYDFIEEENIETGIEKFAEKNDLDLVITIPKKHKLLEGLFKKSHTRELVFHSHVPIMCVHE